MLADPESTPSSSRSPISSTCPPPCRRSPPASTSWSRSRSAPTTAECLPLRDEVHASGLVLQVGTMRRFDPGIAFARDFMRDEIGAVDRPQGVVLRLRLPLRDDRRAAAAACGAARAGPSRRATPRATGAATTCSATAATWSTRRASSAGEIATVRADLVERGGALLLVRRRRVRGRLDRPPRPHDLGPDGLARGLPDLRRARQRRRARASSPGTAGRARSSASRPRTGSTTGRSARTRTSGAARSRASPTRSSRARRSIGRRTWTTGWRRCA